MQKSKPKTVSKPKDPSKRELIDTLPGLKASEIIANAKEKGITLSASYAYSLAAKRRKAASSAEGPKAAQKAARKAKPQGKIPVSTSSQPAAAAAKVNGTILHSERNFLRPCEPKSRRVPSAPGSGMST